MGEREFQNDELDDYLELVSSPEPALLKQLREKTIKEFADYHMISGHVQGRFLSIISKMLQPKHILEIGTFTGYATICLAEGLGENGMITSIEKNPALQGFYESYFKQSGYQDVIKCVIADALKYLEDTEDTYDLVFLDAHKKSYISFYELLLPRLQPGGVILADNTLWKGKVLEEIEVSDKMTQALYEFNQYVKEDQRVEVVLLPLRDGISLIRKK